MRIISSQLQKCKMHKLGVMEGREPFLLIYHHSILESNTKAIRILFFHLIFQCIVRRKNFTFHVFKLQIDQMM